ncbi:MAG: hypothetical protein JXJ04_26745 [Spirochaetales bacterium]|nr:hypothetical protein [Spirochaetales bacterium]
MDNANDKQDYSITSAPISGRIKGTYMDFSGFTCPEGYGLYPPSGDIMREALSGLFMTRERMFDDKIRIYEGMGASVKALSVRPAIRGAAAGCFTIILNPGDLF